MDNERIIKKKEFSEGFFVKLFYLLFKSVFSFFVKIIWIKKISGINNIPKTGGCIIAANHASYFDFFCLSAASPRKIHYLAAEKFFKGKVWRLVMKATGQIKVDRQSKKKEDVYKIVLSALAQGNVIGIFPEGTRSPTGEIQSAFTGVAKFALLARVSIVPVGIKGTYEILPRQKKFPRFSKIAEVNIGEPISVEKFYGREGDEAVLREITDTVMKKIKDFRDTTKSYE